MQPSVASVDFKRLEQRLNAKVDKLKEEERHQGKGVTREAQAIFDSFRRMYDLQTVHKFVAPYANMPVIATCQFAGTIRR